ncbi:hypothetical protein DL771_005726 [Monosporascus sp. 5C6A]|nr:hypothetical protein DL771_005726 [Monosporascus sp. 5C6A]
MSPAVPMEFGQRLLPSLVDEIAETDPHRVLYSVPKTNDPADGFQDISAKTFARAVHRCSWYIEKNLGRGQNFPTITYMGPQDAVYAILVLACIKTGYKLLLNSLRNSLDAHLFLFEKTHCDVFLLPPSFPLPIIKQILDARKMRVLEIPVMQHWFKDGLDQPYPYEKTFAEAVLEPFVVLHTSGSTGFPKPVIQTHGTYSPVDAFTGLLSSKHHRPTFPAMCAGTRVYLGVPLFHTAGLALLLPGCIYSGYTTILGPFPPSADVVDGVHVHGNPQHSVLAPPTLVDLAKDPRHLENLRRLRQITFGGGPLPKAVGDRLSSYIRLLNCLGSTECGVLPIQLCDPEDWPYISMSPVLGHEYRHVSGDLYEQVIIRDPKLKLYQGIFNTFPELKEWHMKDVYSKHPTKEDVWLYRGRTDDIIVFSSGEKLNPYDMESIIETHPAVSAARIAGFGRFQSSLLVEAVTPPTSNAEKEELLNTIWPSVQAANKHGPSYGRIHRDMIIFTLPGKPMLRAGKGTVQRKMTLDLYAAELDALYEANGETDVAADGTNDTADKHATIQEIVKDIIATSTDISANRLDLDTDLFALGLDSLQVVTMTKTINAFLAERGIQQPIETRTVYANPTVAALTAAISVLAEGKATRETVESDEQKMQRLYDLYAAELPISARQAESKPSDGFVVLLTGSTGSLGSYILDSLLTSPRVTKIYCLNRGPASLDRQQKSHAAKGLHVLTDKVECFDTEISKPYFGLSTQAYRKLLGEVTTVVHNAWQVNFNLSIDSFMSHIATVRRFIDFSSQSRFGAQLFFISSISAVGKYSATTRRTDNDGIPERIFEDWRVPQAMGYGQSKLVSERLLEAASREANIPAFVCRLGQVAGPTTAAGIWPKQEWLPSLIASSKYLGKLPVSLGRMETIDWVPVDVLGRSIVELATTTGNSTTPASTSKQTGGAAVFHLVNPQRTTWANLLPAVTRDLDPAKRIETVPLGVWVDALRESASRSEDMVQNPAIKILGFFESLAREEGEDAMQLDTKNAVSVSQTLASLAPVTEDWMENWMRQWAF